MQSRIVAHRGASQAQPEMTVAAYRHAIRLGADGLEADVRMTADGHLVCVHDATVDRTSTGQGPVAAHTLDQLRGLDWMSWRARLRGVGGGGGLVTLPELIELAGGAPRPVSLAIETKHPSPAGASVERRLAEDLASAGWDRPGAPVVVMSFSVPALRRCVDLLPHTPLVLLVDGADQRPDADLVTRAAQSGLPMGRLIIGPAMAMVRRRPHWVAAAHHAGLGVHVWTPDRPADWDLCLRLGVDAIITNDPQRAQSHRRRSLIRPDRDAVP